MKLAEKKINEALDFIKANVNKLTTTERKRINSILESAKIQIEELIRSIDTVKIPETVFDPSDPDASGRLVASKLLTQKKIKLDDLEKFYGSGVYAIYYAGNFKSYARISKTETPIYIGKADPKDPMAGSVLEQGTKLYDRLNEHKKNIIKVSNLDIKDFEVRYLVVKSGMQSSAESCLIHYFKPIWNKETKVCFGIGSHGDNKSKTRTNKRSPWDTLHPGRQWADIDSLDNQKEEEQINKEINRHFDNYQPIKEVNFYALLGN